MCCHQMFVAKCTVCKTVTVGDLDASMHALTHEQFEEGENDDVDDYYAEEGETMEYAEYVDYDEYADNEYLVDYYSRCAYCGDEYTETQMMVHFQECAEVASSNNNSDMTTVDDDDDDDDNDNGEVGGGWAGRQTGRKTSDRV